MRLQLIPLLVCAAAAPAGPAAAKPVEPGMAGARVDVYADGDIVVVTPSSRTSIPLRDGFIDAGYRVDILSGATPTVDTISSATQFEEVRHAMDLGLRGPVAPGATLGVKYVASLESDFVAQGPSVTFGADVLRRMARFSATWRMRIERTSLATGEPLHDAGMTQELDLSWTQLLGRTTRLSVLASGGASVCGDAFGCQASPYRYVRVGDVTLREKHPAQRFRGAAAIRLSQALGRSVALHGGYRFYYDSWQVQAHTGDLSLAVALLGERLMLRATGRFTWQSASSFYRDDYGMVAGGPPPRLGDRRSRAQRAARPHAGAAGGVVLVRRGQAQPPQPQRPRSARLLPLPQLQRGAPPERLADRSGSRC